MRETILVSLGFVAAQFTLAAEPPVKTDTTKSPSVDVSPEAIDKRLKAITQQDGGNKSLTRERIREACLLLRDPKYAVPREFVAPADNVQALEEFRTQIAKIQSKVSLIQFQLSVMLEDLEQDSDARNQETQEWRASFDYARARLLARIAYLYQYNAELGEMRKALPLLDRTKEKGWRLSATDLNFQDRDAAKSGGQARVALMALAQNHPAYAEIAAAEAKEVEKGLRWVAWPR